MGLSELMRMIIIFVTFCLNKKKKYHFSFPEESFHISVNYPCLIKMKMYQTIIDMFD